MTSESRQDHLKAGHYASSKLGRADMRGKKPLPAKRQIEICCRLFNRHLPRQAPLNAVSWYAFYASYLFGNQKTHLHLHNNGGPTPHFAPRHLSFFPSQFFSVHCAAEAAAAAAAKHERVFFEQSCLLIQTFRIHFGI